MILSEGHKFIFVHIPKTAGLSMTDALGSFGRGNVRTIWRSVSRGLPIVESPSTAHFREHDPAWKIIQKLSRPVYDQFYSFSVVRNPFDHAVSHYEFLKQFRIKSTADRVAQMSFEEYLAYRIKPPFWNDTIFARLPSQAYFLLDQDGKMAVNRLIRFENLQSDFDHMVAEIGLIGAQLRHVNKTKSRNEKRPFHHYYDATTEEMVREIYKRDFPLLGYSDRLSDH